MLTPTQNYWWKTKAFKIGLGIFIVLAIIIAVFFGDQISRLLDLLGSRASTTERLTINDDPTIAPGHGALQDGTFNPSEIIYVAPSGDEDGYITLPTLPQ